MCPVSYLAMKPFTILFLLFAQSGVALPVVAVSTAPGNPGYARFTVELVATAQREVLAALSDVRMYRGDGATGELLGALVGAASRGVAVRVLVELRGEGPLPEQQAALAYLAERGVAVRWDSPEVPLHAKFLVVDRQWVVVGSTHWTESALTRSVQLDLAVESEELAAAFGQFFDHLWAEQLKLIPQLAPMPWPQPAVVPLLDPPQGKLHAGVLPALIRGAQESVEVLIYRFAYYPAYPNSPSNQIVDELCRAVARGVRVRALLEGGEDFPDLAGDNRVTGSYLAACGVEVAFDPPGTTLHGKVLIVDGRDVVVTSANFSYASLSQNVEAGVALLGAPEVGVPLRSWFDSLWTEARRLR